MFQSLLVFKIYFHFIIFVYRFFVVFFLASDSGSIVSKCDNSKFFDKVLHVDFSKIGHPCTCVVCAKFVGEVLMLSKNSNAEGCNTQIIVNNNLIFGCAIQAVSYNTLNVQTNKSINVQAEYTQSSRTGTFHQCLEFRQNGKDTFISFLFLKYMKEGVEAIF